MEIASSEGSNSTEAIAEPLPDAGRYVGWFAPGGSTTYDLSTWLVDDPSPDALEPAPGLRASDRAGGQAGAEVELTLEWAGVEAAGTYLGVVTYHDTATPNLENARGFSLVELRRGAAPVVVPILPSPDDPGGKEED